MEENAWRLRQYHSGEGAQRKNVSCSTCVLKVSCHTAVFCALEVDERDQDAAERDATMQTEDTYLKQCICKKSILYR